MRHLATVVVVLSCATTARAQGPAFSSPGSSRLQSSGQTDRFSNEFNPAFSFVLDGLLEYVESDGSEDGLDLTLRAFELGASAHVDPRAWAYAIVVATDDNVALEEGAVIYTGLPGNHTLKAGRFFVDFGKQMQLHEHELRTIDRPLPLRTYLGEELGGDGIQYDNWFAAGDKTLVRYSVGVFGSLVGGEEDDVRAPAASPFDEDRKEPDELAYTARLTALRDVGENGMIQIGASARSVPDFGLEFEPSGDQARGLDSMVLGLDLTFECSDDTQIERFTTGAELLFATGDIGAQVLDTGVIGDPTDDTVQALRDDAFGSFLFADYAWNQTDSAGVQYAFVEAPDVGLPNIHEVDVYYTKMLSEFHRFRVSVTHSDVQAGDDSIRLAVQYTAAVGNHTHGINW